MVEKEKVFSKIKLYLDQQNLSISNIDMTRPWGGFFVINENDSEKFINHFFADLNKADLLKGKLSPKILLVAPRKKLSWQYHHRRSEVWKLIDGNAAVVTSDTDVENETTLLKKGDTITLKKGERHRLIGLDTWGIVAEIWIHTDPAQPSDEDDIVRLQDDFGR
jgi:mannose-6-phosphate isomerase